MRLIHERVEKKGSQLVIATHSPILLAYPGAKIYLLDGEGMRTVTYEETEHYAITARFLANREACLRAIFADDLIDEA